MGGGCYQGDVHLPAGHTLIPVNKKQVIDATNQLLDQGCEIIGIIFIYSFVDPKHEHELEIAKEVIENRNLEVPVICSADVAPVSKENSRMKSLIFQCLQLETNQGISDGSRKSCSNTGFNGRL